MDRETFNYYFNLVFTIFIIILAVYSSYQSDKERETTKRLLITQKDQLIQAKEEMFETREQMIKTKDQLIQAEEQMFETREQMIKTNGQLIQVAEQVLEIREQLVKFYINFFEYVKKTNNQFFTDRSFEFDPEQTLTNSNLNADNQERDE